VIKGDGLRRPFVAVATTGFDAEKIFPKERRRSDLLHSFGFVPSERIRSMKTTTTMMMYYWYHHHHHQL
jgi:hypothetical protein